MKRTCNVHIYITENIGISKHEKHLRLLSLGTKLFINFEFKGSSTQGERYTFFLFWLFHLPTPPPPSRARPTQVFGEQAKAIHLLLRQNSTLLTFSKIPKILRALPVHDVIRTCSPRFPSRASIVTSLSDATAPRAR